MTNGTSVARARLARLGGVALLSVTLILSGGAISSARPSHADLEAAKAKLDSLNRHLDLLVEQYDQARIKLQKVQHQLVDARREAARAESERLAAQQHLSARAAAAYEGTGSALEALLGATSLSDFTDRLEFVNSVAQQDADAANQAAIKNQEAVRARQRLNDAIARQQQTLGGLRSKTSEIKSSIAQQQGMVKQLEAELAKPVYPKPAPVAAPTVQGTPSHPHTGGGNPNPPPSPDPQPPSSGADIAVRAAFSVIGVPYHWGGSDPNTGFVFLNNNANFIGAAAAHEAGHGFGLQHQSSYDAPGNKIDEYSHGNQNNHQPKSAHVADAWRAVRKEAQLLLKILPNL